MKDYCTLSEWRSSLWKPHQDYKHGPFAAAEPSRLWKEHWACQQQPGHTLNSLSLFLLGNFYGLENFSGFYIKVHCKHLLSLCMVSIHRLLGLSTGNWPERVQGTKQQDSVNTSASARPSRSSSAGVVWALSSSYRRLQSQTWSASPVWPWLESWRMNKHPGRVLMSAYRHGVCILGWNVLFSSMTSAYGEIWGKRISSPAFLCGLSISLLSWRVGGSKKVWGSGSELTLWVWQDKRFIAHPP